MLYVGFRLVRKCGERKTVGHVAVTGGAAGSGDAVPPAVRRGGQQAIGRAAADEDIQYLGCVGVLVRGVLDDLLQSQYPAYVVQHWNLHTRLR